MNSTNIFVSSGAVKLYLAVAMVIIWVTLVWNKVTGADDLISLCKYGLTALATHYLTYADPAAEAKADEGSTTITIPTIGVPK